MRAIILAAALLALAGCAEPRVRDLPITEEEHDSLVDPVPGAEIGDYHAYERTLRVFGTQGSPAFATLTDVKTWQSWNLRPGDTLGRGLRVADVKDGTLSLVDANGRAVTIARGSDVQVRTIAHRLDDASLYEGRATWRVEAASMREVLDASGPGVMAELRDDLLPVPLTELVAVHPEGVLGRLDLREGDFLIALDGESFTPALVDTLAARATTPGTFTLTVFRASAPGPRTYRVE